MRVEWRQNGRKLTFNFELDKDDSVGPFRNIAGNQRLHILSKKSFYILLPEDMNIEDTHNDLIGLSMIILLDVFVDSKLTLQFPISQSIHNAYLKTTGKKILPVDNELKPRVPHDSSVPGLAFSGGVDSMTALEILPKNTILIFSDRIQKRSQRYNKTAAYQACEQIEKTGREVFKIQNTIEYIIEPLTYSHALASGIPAILLADHLKLDSVAFGNILETVYGPGRNKYEKDYPAVKTLDKVFVAAGLPACHVTGGLSEVATTKILLNSPYAALAQSCMYGEELGKPCLNCLKCFRKILLENVARSEEVDSKFVDHIFENVNEAEKAFRSIPLILQNIYMFITAHARTDHAMLHLLKKKTGATKKKTKWAMQWFVPSIELLPEKHRQGIVDNITKHISPMSSREVRRVKSWNLHCHRYLPVRRYWHWKFWKEYGSRYDRYMLMFDRTNLKMQTGEEVKPRLFIQKPFRRKHEITEEVRWSQNKKEVVHAKRGVVRAKSSGKAIVYARYGNSRAELPTIVD